MSKHRFSADTDSSSAGKPDEEETKTDRLFDRSFSAVEDFKFGAETAAVFDDMVDRSVPFYAEIQRMVCELASDFAVAGSSLYDFGCATGTTLSALHSVVDPGVRFVGIDNSDEMLDKARAKLKSATDRQIDFVNGNLHDLHSITDASVGVMIFTLQFVRPLHRQRLVQAVFDGLREGGVYSDLEIAQKREALENVLIPYHFDENRELLRSVGFRHVEEFFRWYNFCGMVAVR